MNWKFWERKNGKPKLVGMSQKPTLIPQRQQKKPVEQKVAKIGWMASLSNPVQPYISIISNDIKSFLHIDDKSRKEKETYNDFMKDHFGKH